MFLSLSAGQRRRGWEPTASSHMAMPNQKAGCSWKFQVLPVPFCEGCDLRIGRQRQPVEIRVARSGRVGVEQRRRLQILYWQEIPSLLRATADDGAQVSRQLPDWFQQEIDRVAMEQGLVGSDAYLEQWHWAEPEERDGAPNDVLDAVEAELVSRPRAHLASMIDGGRSSERPGDGAAEANELPGAFLFGETERSKRDETSSCVDRRGRDDHPARPERPARGRRLPRVRRGARRRGGGRAGAVERRRTSSCST